MIGALILGLVSSENVVRRGPRPSQYGTWGYPNAFLADGFRRSPSKSVPFRMTGSGARPPNNTAMLRRPNAHATISGNSPCKNASPCYGALQRPLQFWGVTGARSRHVKADPRVVKKRASLALRSLQAASCTRTVST